MQQGCPCVTSEGHDSITFIPVPARNQASLGPTSVRTIYLAGARLDPVATREVQWPQVLTALDLPVVVRACIGTDPYRVDSSPSEGNGVVGVVCRRKPGEARSCRRLKIDPEHLDALGVHYRVPEPSQGTLVVDQLPLSEAIPTCAGIAA